jgi:hypothetical protein
VDANAESNRDNNKSSTFWQVSTVRIGFILARLSQD